MWVLGWGAGGAPPSGVWVVAAGAGKAPAVAGALTGTPETELPVAGARGTVTTRWLLDTEAASDLPDGFVARVS